MLSMMPMAHMMRMHACVHRIDMHSTCMYSDRHMQTCMYSMGTHAFIYACAHVFICTHTISVFIRTMYTLYAYRMCTMHMAYMMHAHACLCS